MATGAVSQASIRWSPCSSKPDTPVGQIGREELREPNGCYLGDPRTVKVGPVSIFINDKQEQRQ